MGRIHKYRNEYIKSGYSYEILKLFYKLHNQMEDKVVRKGIYGFTLLSIFFVTAVLSGCGNRNFQQDFTVEKNGEIIRKSPNIIELGSDVKIVNEFELLQFDNSDNIAVFNDDKYNENDIIILPSDEASINGYAKKIVREEAEGNNTRYWFSDPMITEFVDQIDVADVIELTADDFELSSESETEYLAVNHVNSKPQVMFLAATNKAEFSLDGVGSVELIPVEGGAEIKIKDVKCGKNKDIKISGSFGVKNLKIIPDISWKKMSDVVSKPLSVSCRTKADFTQNIEVKKGKDFKAEDVQFFDRREKEDLFVKLAGTQVPIAGSPFLSVKFALGLYISAEGNVEAGIKFEENLDITAKIVNFDLQTENKSSASAEPYVKLSGKAGFGLECRGKISICFQEVTTAFVKCGPQWETDTEKLTTQHLPIDGYLKMEVGFDSAGILKELEKDVLKFELEIWNEENSPLQLKHCIEFPLLNFNLVCQHKGGGGVSGGTGVSDDFGNDEKSSDSLHQKLINDTWVDNRTQGSLSRTYKFNDDNTFEQQDTANGGYKENFRGTYQLSDEGILTLYYEDGGTYTFKYLDSESIFAEEFKDHGFDWIGGIVSMSDSE